MNTQIRRLFVVVLLLFAALGLILTNNQVFQAPELNADARNQRTILHAAETDRGPIIVDGTAIASSQKVDGSSRFQRSYADGPLYAALTGYFSAAFSQSTGMEAAAEDILDGQSQTLLAQRLRNLFTGANRQGGGVVLTINPQMQKIAAEKLGNRRGAVVALNAQTGAILALYSSPSYDPNQLAAFDSAAANDAYNALLNDPGRPLYNRAIAGDLYAPGSSFKILTTIALLEKGVAQPDTPMDSPVSTVLPGTVTSVSNIESTDCGSGKPSLAEAFARSCNTTFILASEKLTHADMADVANRFEFGSTQKIPLTVTPSIFPEKTDAAQLAMSSIGQFSVKATPLEMAMVAQTIAKNGQMMNPYLIEQIVDGDLQVRSSATPSPLGQKVKPEIAQQLTRMMQGVVDQPYGTGTTMALPGVSVAAKTGTAEVGDGSNRANAWAVGFAPADRPTIAFAVLVEGDDRVPVPHGGSDAGPIARALLEAGLK